MTSEPVVNNVLTSETAVDQFLFSSIGLVLNLDATATIFQRPIVYQSERSPIDYFSPTTVWVTRLPTDQCSPNYCLGNSVTD